MRRPSPRQTHSLTAALALVLAALAAPAGAAPLKAPLGQSVRLQLARPVGAVVVADPSIADVTVVDPRTVFIMGKAPGMTSVTLMDQAQRPLFDSQVSVSAPGAVSYFSGAKRTELSCTPDCAQVAGKGAAGAAPAAASGAQGSTSGVPTP